MTGPGYGFSLAIGGMRADIVTDRAETRDALDRLLLPWLPRTAVGTHPAGLVLQTEGGQDGAPFEVRSAGALIASSRDLEETVPFLQAWLDDAIVHKLTDLVPVHAGVVSWGDAAVLLPGVSHAGKSTLVAELLRRGCVYFSDEYALVDGAGRVHPYPRALMIRNAAGESRPALASAWNAGIGTAPAPARLVLTLHYSPDAAWAVERIGQSEMVLELLKNTPHCLAEARDLLSPFIRLAAGAACYSGVRGEASEAAGCILDLLDRKS
jgi:hypothetical protein